MGAQSTLTTPASPSAFARQTTYLLGSGVAIGVDVPHTLLSPFHWDRGDLIWAGVAVGAVAGVAVFDRRINEWAIRHRGGDYKKVADMFEPFATTYGDYVRLGAFVGGVVLGDRNLEAAGIDAYASMLICTGVVHTIITYPVGRTRPRDSAEPYRFAPFSSNTSFPSGHTIRAFATAGAFAAHYPDSPWVWGIAYGLAGLVAFARVEHGAHWASDTVASAALGIAVSQAVVRFNILAVPKLSAWFDRLLRPSAHPQPALN